MSIPKFGKGGCCINRGPNFHVEPKEDLEVPKPGPGQLLVKLICTVADDVRCAGHEGAGVVVAVGEGVDTKKWPIGARAGIKPVWDVCGECEACTTGMETICDSMAATGASVQGTYCQYLVSPAKYTTRIPDNIPWEYAAPILCSGGTSYVALKNCGAVPGEWVVILGAAGGVGHMATTYGAAMSYRILAIDAGDDKRELCEELGAEAFIDFTKTKDVAAEVLRITGGGAKAVIVAAGHPSSYKGATSFLKKGGTLTAVGLPALGTAVAGADPFELCFRKLKIQGTLVAGMNDVAQALDFAARGKIKPRITLYKFSQFREAADAIANSRVAGRGVVVFEDSDFEELSKKKA